MAQARVTDYFAQNKKGGVGRSVRSKGQKVSVDVSDSVVIAKPTTSSRATRSARVHATPEPQKHVHQEFLKVIDEVLSADTVETATEVSHVSLTASPRTPKRTSAEFDVCSVVFASTAEQHSSAKKRLRLGRTSPEDRTVPKTARKRLDLLKHDDKEQVTLSSAKCCVQTKCVFETRRSVKRDLDAYVTLNPFNKMSLMCYF